MEALLGLFVTSFLAATLVPVFSEGVLGGLLLAGHDPWALWIVATVGNTAGSVLNWFLAVHLRRFEDRRWFPFQPEKLGRAQVWFDRYGTWTLLLAWMPLVGDPLTFVAGLMRTPLWRFVVLVAAGKGARYALVLYLATQLRSD